MGKKIIVKGADFSVNGFRSPVSGSLTIYNYALSLIADGDNYGNINTSSYPKRGATTVAVFIPLGAKVTIKGLKPDSNTGLRFDGCYYSSSTIGHSTVVGDMHGGSSSTDDMFMYNADGSNNEVTFTNTYGDYWFIFGFAKGSTKSDDVVVSNYSLTYEYIV